MTIDTKPSSTRRTFVAAAATAGVGAGASVGLSAVSGCTSTKPATHDRRVPVTETTSLSLKPITTVLSPQERHWVGDGFHVSTVFSPYHLDAEVISPFILLDHQAPEQFSPTQSRRGVGEHPHRGFETVTFAYQGEVDHRDSHGGGGRIGPGDVQWMTAASGVVHEEFHSERFAETGGIFEMVQLWVNLPASQKMQSPRYQALSAASFPELDFGAATGRLIAGSLLGKTGPAQTHTPITMFDLTLPASSQASFELPTGMTTMLLVLEGNAVVQEDQSIQRGDLVVLDRDAPGTVHLKAEQSSRVLVLAGAPLGEPVVAQGPFVMNTRAEIAQAMRDFRAGLMGTLAPTS